MINRRFIVYKTYAAFKAALTEGIISPESIVFVEDASIIWTHEKEYICAGYGEQLEELNGKIVNIEDLLATFALKENIPTKVSQLDNDSNYVVQEQLNLKADKDSVYIKSQIEDLLENKQSILDEYDFMFINGRSTFGFSEYTIPTITVDSILSESSNNPVCNSTITRALSSKANTSILDSYVKTTSLIGYLFSKQDKLTSGTGIKIKDNVISTTLDSSIYKIVRELPNAEDVDENKIYVLEVIDEDVVTHYQYRYINNQWIEIGRTEASVDISSYLNDYHTKAEIQKILNNYALAENMSSYYTKNESDERYQLIGDYLTMTEGNNRYAPIDGGYVTSVYLENILNNLKNYVINNYVNKADVYTKNGNTSTSEESETTTGGAVIIRQDITIDSQLNSSSSNAVENAVITSALNLKADKSQLSDYALKSSLVSYVKTNDINNIISNKQDKLTAGAGISIEDNVISSTLDTSVYIIIDSQSELPVVGRTDKIYIKESVDEENNYTYIEWKYKEDEGWVQIGEQSPTIDLSPYLKVSDAQSTYQPKGQYATSNELSEAIAPLATATEVDATYQKIGDYALSSEMKMLFDGLKAQYNTLRETIINTYQVAGDYADVTEVNRRLQTLQQFVMDLYVHKEDVYDPNKQSWDSHSADGYDITVRSGIINSSAGGASSSASNMTTLTVAQYQALVDAGQVQSDMYYFTYEGEAETGSWSFGDQFPIILTENWTFGGTFPITLN